MGHLMISTGAGSGCLLKTFRANRLIWENQVGSGTVAGISTPFLGGVHHLLQISYQKPLIYDHLPEPEKSVERRNGKEITMNLFLMPELFPTCLGILIQLSPSFYWVTVYNSEASRGVTCVQLYLFQNPLTTPWHLIFYSTFMPLQFPMDTWHSHISKGILEYPCVRAHHLSTLRWESPDVGPRCSVRHHLRLKYCGSSHGLSNTKTWPMLRMRPSCGIRRSVCPTHLSLKTKNLPHQVW